jgi:16S rRNA (uracil1498-N3)-methyltransferase
VSARRFLLTAPPERGRAILDPDESKHAVKVLRLSEGDAVVLFDGKGIEWPGTVERASRKGVVVAVGPPRASEKPAGPRVVLGTAVPKGKRMSTLLAMATEAGVDAVFPVAFARSAVREPGESKFAHWRRTVAEASRQSGRAWMPALEAECGVEEFLARPRAAGERRLLPTTSGTPDAIGTVLARGEAPATVVLLVGPEGGFTADEERAAVAAGFEPCGLGPHVMRVETAGVAAVVMVKSGTAHGAQRTEPKP